MHQSPVIWQIGKVRIPGQKQRTVREFRSTPEALPVFNYHVDADPRSAAQPDCPGWLFKAGNPPRTQGLKKWGTAAAKLNIHFTLANNYKAGELTLIYDRFGSDTDHIQFDGELLANQKGAGDGVLKRFRHVFGKLAKGKHVLTLSIHGGIGKSHLLDCIKLVATQAAPAPQPDLSIGTGLQVDATKGAGGDPYLEITSHETAAVDLSGWAVYVEELKLKLGFPAGTSLQPGKSIRIFGNHLDATTGVFCFGVEGAIWVTAGDTISLCDKDGSLVTCLEIDPETSQPASAEGGTGGGGSSGGTGGSSPGGSGAGGGGLFGVIDTSAVVAAALEQMNRQSVLGILKELVAEIDEHGGRLSKIDGDILKLRAELVGQIDALRASVDNHQGSITELNVALSALKQQVGDFYNNVEQKVGDLFDNRLQSKLPDLIAQVGSALDETIQQKLSSVVNQPNAQELLAKIAELSAKIELLKKSSDELDKGEQKQVESLIKQLLTNIDLAPIVSNVQVAVSGRSFRLTELLTILAGGDKVAATNFTYQGGDVSGAQLTLVGGVSVTFVCTRHELPDTAELEYQFQTKDWRGLPASFVLRFRRQTTQMAMCGRALSLSSYDVVHQSNIVFHLTSGS